MRLTTYTDYTLRVLIYLAGHRDSLPTIEAIAASHGISKNHLTKVVHRLALLGLVETFRGRNGGVRLGREPADINIGAVVRSSEPNFYMAECFAEGISSCRLAPRCTLKDALGNATAAYLAVLDSFTLSDLVSTGSGVPVWPPSRCAQPCRLAKPG